MQPLSFLQRIEFTASPFAMNSTDNNSSSIAAQSSLNESSSHLQDGINPGPPADLGKRFLAAVIDGLVLLVVSNAVSEALPWGAGSFMIVYLALEFFYSGYLLSTRSATWGKMAVDLVVVDEAGRKLSFLRAGLRDTLGRRISVFVLLIGYLMVFYRKDKRALHDFIFQTEVRAKKA